MQCSEDSGETVCSTDSSDFSITAHFSITYDMPDDIGGKARCISPIKLSTCPTPDRQKSKTLILLRNGSQK